jgi:hypothetical protein
VNRAKSYRISSFREAGRGTAYSFLDFNSNYWNGVGCFLPEAGAFRYRSYTAYFTTSNSKWSSFPRKIVDK